MTDRQRLMVMIAVKAAFDKSYWQTFLAIRRRLEEQKIKTEVVK